MKVTRIIHPVGQGGFYTETFSDDQQEATFVYDCGGFDNAQKKMNSYLDCFLSNKKPKKKIEAVFISHFHADHINGLQYLLENAEVKYLFLPQLSEDVMLEALVYNYCLTRSNKLVNDFLISLYNGKVRFGSNRARTRIIQIESVDDHILPDDLHSESFYNNNTEFNAWDWRKKKVVDLSTVETLSASTVLQYCSWLYIPYNSKVRPAKETDLKKKLSKMLGTEITVENLPLLIEKYTVEACREIYKKVFGSNQNHTSMILFSGTIENVKIFHCEDISNHQDDENWLYYKNNRHLNLNNPNMLYTGDYEPNRRVGCMWYYSKLWNTIATIQIPHHGSQNNYDEELYKNPSRGIVSVGNNNSHHHPNVDTLIKIQNQGCYPVIVTEDKSSMKIYQYLL
ncbi:MAG: MBL fold metallo-hydrolase [Bacteroidales bacterium]|nr:MBL fold metallo-hydrolase [Bacteroidales bacterium]